MDRISELEAQAIYILREAYANFKDLGMLWSIGKDSTVLLWLARKAFIGHLPFPLIHIDTGFKIPKMIKYRDELAKKWKLDMIVGQNVKAIKEKNTFPDGKLTRLQCCRELKTLPLQNTLNGKWPRKRFNHEKGDYEIEENGKEFTGVIVGVRSDEEGSRSKERYFSPRDKINTWDIAGQPPELWDQFKTEFAPGTHIRIHPLLDWTELDLWKYIEREKIPIIDLYFSNEEGCRYRSLGCGPCTSSIKSKSKNVKEIVAELESGELKNIAERSGRAQDKEDGGGLETLRKEGYM